MGSSIRRLRVFLLVVPLLVAPSTARGAEVMCDTSFQDCRATLFSFIRAETESIDIAMWFMEDLELANLIISRFTGGLPIRALVDPRRNPTTPMNGTILDMFERAGIPMRYKVGGGIMHWKYMIFNAQKTVQFSAANYGDYYFKPATPYVDYTDEGIYFCDDPAVLNSFRRKFDDSWIDLAGFAHYANVAGSPAREYPLYAIDPSVSFVPAQNFATRSTPLYDAETQAIDVIMYKITESVHADGIIRAVKRGVPVRLITEPERYRYQGNVWHAYHVDRLYAAGVQIRHRAHQGFLHQKSTLLYSQGLTIFGSSNWTSESNKSQYEHNYFTDKAWFFTWFRNNFNRKWGNLTGHAETAAFVPLPPDQPVYVSPANGAAGVSTTGATIGWKPGPWAHKADIYLGESSSPPLLASVSVSPNTTKTYTLPALAPGKRYYWKVVSKTMAGKTAAGATYAFTTAGGTPAPDPDPEPEPDPEPQPPGALDVVLYASGASARSGGWIVENDATAAGGKRIRHPNGGAAKLASALASPTHYFELTFTAEQGRPYRLWIRGRADGNGYANDSVFVQFSGSVNASGSPVFRIGTSSATSFNLESCSGCGLSGWGWEDNGWGTGVAGVPIYFQATGTQKIRLQTREDGLSIDQVVLSADAYLTRPPGATKNDTVILPASSGGASAPPPSSSGDIVLYAADAVRTGSWTVVSDASAAGGRRLLNPNAGIPKVATAAASPSSYAELTFTAEAGRAYRLWLRGKADGNSYANDSIHLQFSGAVTAAGAAAFRIGTADSTVFNLEACSGCGVAGWGWEDNGWGPGVAGPLIYFASSGTQKIRLQPREDGLSIDQIVLSPDTYLKAAPGPTKNDSTILPR